MRTAKLTETEKKQHKQKWNKGYYGTLGHARSQVRYWTRILAELEQREQEQATNECEVQA